MSITGRNYSLFGGRGKEKTGKKSGVKPVHPHRLIKKSFAAAFFAEEIPPFRPPNLYLFKSGTTAPEEIIP